MSANSSQTGLLPAGPSPSSYRHHASFSEPSSSTPNPPPVIRRESMTRLFLKPNAVFVAFEELQQQQEQQRATAPPRVKRYQSIEDENGAKTKSEPENLNVSLWLGKVVSKIIELISVVEVFV